MEFPAKQRMLLAIYAEYKKNSPDLGTLTPKSLDMAPAAFGVAVDLLESEGLIKGAVIVTGENCPIPKMVCLNNAKITQEGINRARCLENEALACRDKKEQESNKKVLWRAAWPSHSAGHPGKKNEVG